MNHMRLPELWGKQRKVKQTKTRKIPIHRLDMQITKHNDV